MPARRRWVYRLAALTLGPLLLLALLEGALRLGGYGFSTSFFKRLDIGGQECLVENDRFGLRFFPPALVRLPAPIVMKARKPAGTVRIFILGESAALGDPRPQFGAGRYLEVLLRQRYPGQDFELVNTAITAINSHVILPIARECAAHQGDVWIVYMGNNEMVGPFGAATVFGRQAPPLALVRLTVWVQQARLGQLLVDLSRRLKGSSAQPSWHGLEMFQENKVSPDDPRKEVVYGSFARNLQDILQAGLHSGAKVLLSTVAVNLKDCPPFASEAKRMAVAEAQRAECRRLCSEAAAAEAQARFAEALEAYAKAETVLPGSAEVHFHIATDHLRLGDRGSAAVEYQMALDCDALPCRADSRINGIIKDLARRLAGPGLAFCDAAAALASASPEGIPGQESFYEHVHLNFDGNYRLARAWAAQLEKVLPPALTRRGAAGWASQEACERLLGLTDWNRLSVFEEMDRRLGQPPFSGQLDNARRLEAAKAAVAELERRIAAASPDQARQNYLEALKSAPDDHNLHEAYAEFLEAIHDRPQATVEREKVCSLIPHFYFPHYSLGQILKEQGRLAEALQCLQRAAALNPRGSNVRLELGIVLARRNQWEAALAQFDLARRFNPDDPQALLYSGEVLRQLNRAAESLDRWRQAIRLQPAYWEAHYRLGEGLAQQGNTAAAAQEFAQVLNLNPGYIKALMNLGVALVKLGRPAEAVQQFDQVLRLDPRNQQAAQFRQQAMSRVGFK